MRIPRHSPYRPPRAPRLAFATSAGRSLLLAVWLVAASAFYITDVLADRLIDEVWERCCRGQTPCGDRPSLRQGHRRDERADSGCRWDPPDDASPCGATPDA